MCIICNNMQKTREKFKSRSMVREEGVTGATGARSTASRSERREPGSTVDGVEVGAALPVVQRQWIRPHPSAATPAPELAATFAAHSVEGERVGGRREWRIRTRLCWGIDFIALNIISLTVLLPAASENQMLAKT
jgi:hypothetical protein